MAITVTISPNDGNPYSRTFANRGDASVWIADDLHSRGQSAYTSDSIENDIAATSGSYLDYGPVRISWDHSVGEQEEVEVFDYGPSGPSMPADYPTSGPSPPGNLSAIDIPLQAAVAVPPGVTSPPALSGQEAAVVMDAAEAGCTACDAMLGEVLMRLISSLETMLLGNDKTVNQLQRKITRKVVKEQGEIDNIFECVKTTIENGVNQGLYTNQLTLATLQEQVASCFEVKDTKAAVGGVNVSLDISKLVEVLKEAVEVLKEIRDRMTGFPHEEKGEIPAEEIPAFDTSVELVLSDPDDQTVNWT